VPKGTLASHRTSTFVPVGKRGSCDDTDRYVKGGLVLMSGIERAKWASIRNLVGRRLARPTDGGKASTRRKVGGRRREGQAIVEFAVVLPIFLLILCAILDFGVVLYSQMTVINAAREGARAATLMADEPQSVIQDRAGDRADAAAGGLDITTTATCGACKPGNPVIVTVRYDHHLFFPLLFGSSIPISSTVQMVLEETGTGGS
jgi:TadE-like protein